MGWEVILSNDEVVKQNESDIECWRQLAIKAKAENLQIKQIVYNGEDPHPDTPLISYFIIYDIFVPNVLKGGNEQHIKIGIGGFYADNNKSRIHWYKVQGNPILYTEIIHKSPDIYKKFCIDRMKNA